MTLSCWNNTIAIGSTDGAITILDAITGSQVAVLSEHTDWIGYLAFSSDGTLLISMGTDGTAKLWDVQTGGVVKTPPGHTNWGFSASISADNTTIALGSTDNTIHMWNIQTRECYQIIKQENTVKYVGFSPIHPQHLISVSGDKIWWWDTDGHQIAPPHDGSFITFSSDGTLFASCNGSIVTIWNSNSREVVAEFYIADSNINCYCFSPDNRLVAAAFENTAYIWDITSSDPCLIETIIGNANDFVSFSFSSPSTFITISGDRSIKFWQIHTSSMKPAVTDPKSTSHISSPIKSITLQVKDSITITSDSDGVVRVWDLLTGLCNASFQIPAKASHERDVQLIDGRLITVWYADEKIHVWDIEKEELLQMLDPPSGNLRGLKISGDGSKIFILTRSAMIRARSIWTGEGMVEAELYYNWGEFSIIDGSKVWVEYPGGLQQGWDFGVPDSSPVELPNWPTNKFHPNGTVVWDSRLLNIKDVTGKVVFQLPKRLGNYTDIQWNGQYLVACYKSGEVLVLDFSHIFL